VSETAGRVDVTRPDDWPLVGRDIELAQLTAMLVDANRNGRPGVAVVEGDLGVGKTRLLDEVAARGRAHGMTVRCGHATEFGRPGPPGVFAGSLGAALACQGEVALILDDLQWADQTSLDLVGSLVSEVPAAHVVVLLGCRSGQLPATVRSAVERASNAALWLRLDPLSVGDTDRLLDDEPAPRRRALHLASGGNPRYLRILACAPRTKPADLSAMAERLDGRVADALDRTITDELRVLDDSQRSILLAASMLGDNVDLDLVAEIAELDKVATAGVVDELVRVGLLHDSDGRLRFVHPLVRIAAYRLAGPGARVLAHRRAAEWLHRRGAGVTQQAQHLELAAELGDSVAADVLAAAAETMLGSAPATSVRWWRAALRVLPQGPDMAQVRSRLRVLLAKALVASGDLGAGQAELGDLSGLTTQARPAAVRQLAVIARLLGDLPAARRLAGTELRRTGDRDTRPDLRFELVTAELLAGRWSQALKSAGALDAFSARRHPGLPAVAASLRTLSAVPGGQLAELMDLLRHATELVDGLDDGALCDVLDVTVLLGWMQLLVDNVAEALRHIDRGLLLAQRRGQRHVMAQLYPIQAIAHCRNGSIAESLRAADEAVAVALSVGSTEMTTFARTVRLRPLWLREGPLAASRAAAEVDAAPRLGSTWHRMIADASAAEVLLWLDRAEDSRARLQPWLVDESSTTSALAPGWCALLSRAYLAAGNLAGAHRWLDHATGRVSETRLAGQLGAVAHAEAAVLLAEHQANAAAARASAAADQYASVGLVVRAAQARMTLAEALLRDGQVAPARRELGNSRAVLADAGADWLAAQAARAQRQLGARLPRFAQQSGQRSLTTREREIAELVAQGKTNRVIADSLYLSPRTVDAHVRRILTKFGVTSRAAVARHLADKS
jgi:DNA-binding NarL/FixJ family response regulator